MADDFMKIFNSLMGGGDQDARGTAEIAAVPAMGVANQVGAPVAGNPTLGMLLQHFGSGAPRRTMSGQLEGQPAPDPFTNLNAMRESQQAHDLDRMNHSIAMQDLRAQGGQLPLAPFTPNAGQIRADLNARQGLGQSTFGADAVAADPQTGVTYGPAPQGPLWTSATPTYFEPWMTDPSGQRRQNATGNIPEQTPAQPPVAEPNPFRPFNGVFANLFNR